MRFKGAFLGSSIFSVLFLLLFGGFYPEESMGNIVALFHSMGMFINVTQEATGWSIWLAILLGMFMYFIIAITSINIGSRVIPTREVDGAEFFMGSNPMNPRLFYIENVLAGLIVIFLMMLPSYLIVLIQTWIHNAMDIVGSITLVFLSFLVMAYFFISITSAITAAIFQRKIPLNIGFVYVFFGLIMELLGDNPDLKGAANLSVNYYMNITALLFGEDFDFTPILTVLIISVVFTVIGFLRVKSPHYVEKAGNKERISIVDSTIGRLVKPQSFLGRKFPLITEQLRKDMGKVLAIIIMYSIFFPILLNGFAAIGDELISVLAGFDTVTVRIFLQGNEVQASILGYGIMKFYSNAWMFFGIFSMIVAASIPTREILTNSQDIIYGFNVKPSRLIFRRLIAMLIEFSIILWYAFGLMALITVGNGQEFIDDFATVSIQFNYFFITWIHYGAIFIALVGVAMLPREVGKGRKYAIAFFLISLVLNMFAYVDERIEFIKYFSIFHYYEPVPILYGEVGLVDGILKSSTALILCLLFFFATLKYRYKDSSLY
ncbi:MAG: hypothetical protein ACTSYI_09965 [Promethearchaeota archaeon]